MLGVYMRLVGFSSLRGQRLVLVISVDWSLGSFIWVTAYCI